MRVSLFITCLVDQLWPEIGASAVAVLRRAGCEVLFDQRQTCCGQPAFNTGYRSSIDGHLAALPADVARQAREAPAIAVQLASRVPGGDALATAAREAFTTGMRYAVLLGMALLAIGALFVWFRGASRTEEVLEDDLDVRYWEEALPLYAELQIAAAPDADELVAAGALDRRVRVLPSAFAELVAVRAEGLTDEEQRELHALAPEVQRFVEQVASHRVPETIQNDDFTDGSIFIRDGSYRFLDWGDACVSHPFFALTVTQRVIEIRHKLPLASKEIERVRDSYLEPFTRFEPREELESMVEPARRIGQICRAAMRLDAHRTGAYSDEPDELAWSLRLLLDPEVWRTWHD